MNNTFYRKYRPKKFKDIIGQEITITILKNSLIKKSLANSYVFSGTKGTGKTSVAKIFANAVNCTNLIDGDICGGCEVCIDFINNQTIDIYEIDAASNNGVDDVRKIIENISYFPNKFSKKVYIIDEAHMLTTQAWNALLKTIEEPPKHVLFIFATTEVHKIPSTIISRCQMFNFKPIEYSKLKNLLIEVCKKEEIIFNDEAIQTICNLSTGSVRDSLSILQQVAILTKNKITSNDVYKIFGFLNPKEVYNLFLLILNNNVNDVLLLLDSYSNTGINILNLVKDILNLLIEKLYLLTTNNKNLIKKFSYDELNFLNINEKQNILLIEIWQDAFYKINSFSDNLISLKLAIFQTINVININKTERKETNSPIPQLKIKEKNQEVNVVELPKLDKIIKINEIYINQKKSPNIEKKQKNSVKTNYDKLIEQCFVNKTEKNLKKAKNILQEVKNNIIINEHFMPLSCAQNILFASENCIVILFDDEVDSKIMNDFIYDYDFILNSCKYWDHPIFMIGTTIDKINNMKNDLQAALKNKAEIKDCDIAVLRDILDENPTIEQLAYNCLFKN